jgi:hypothetical protein
LGSGGRGGCGVAILMGMLESYQLLCG